jgi:predicted DNA-binding mobile mystery protein A
MATKTSKLRRKQLDKQFANTRSLYGSSPKGGWVREIRSALGMSMQALGQRLGVIKQRIEALEKAEVEGKVTVESLKKAAEAMDCDFVYAFVPRKGLQKFLEQEAQAVAMGIVGTTSHSMNLELQGTSKSSKSDLVADIAKDLIDKEDRRIWSKTK